MQSYSQRRYDDNNVNEDAFDDDTAYQSSSFDIKLRRTNADPSNYPPILHRALSTVSANQTLVHNQRNLLAKNFRRISINDEIVTIDHNDADASFLLPNLHELPDEISTRVMDSLVDTPTMVTLEETRRLNWWVNKKLPYPKLYPLLTSGDGNCLLHATSLAMWGFHDHSLSMRKALNETMITSKPNNSLYRRWRWAQSVQNKKYGLVFSEQEWNEEWKGLLRLSSAEPRISQTSANNIPSDANPPNDDPNRSKSSQTVTSPNVGGSTKSSSPLARQYYESLEEFHVYVLANNIRRPIVVYSDTVLRTNDGEAISPIEFGGIYLPLEIPPEKCHKQPVFLAFDAAHFSALVPMEQNSKPPARAVNTYRIPLIDIDTVDLLPIHYFIDPGADFAWPIEEELSDDKIYLYTHFGESRMDTLEKYLNLARESSCYNTLNLSPSSTNNQTSNIQDDVTSNTESHPTSSTNIDSSSSINESNSTATPVSNKKLSRPSLNSFSKIIRRTFIEPFASVKRASLKHQRQHPHTDTSDTSVLNEIEQARRASSPLLNRRTNMLTIIVTNFQPKRPKTSDNMIKNYIDACMNEYRLEKSPKQINENSISTENDNHSINNNYSDWNKNTSSSYQQPMAYNRYQSSVSTTRNSQNSPSSATAPITETSKRKLPSVPVHLTNKTNVPTKHLQQQQQQRHRDIDDNDDLLPIENGQFSSNISYVQQTQRKPAHLIQSNSLELSYGRHHYPESYVNGLSSTRSVKPNPPEESLKSRFTPTTMVSTFQPGLLKRQQSLVSDNNIPTQRVPDVNSKSRISVKTNNNNHQSKRSTNGTYRISNSEQ